jgi:hypothetical protein
MFVGFQIDAFQYNVADVAIVAPIAPNGNRNVEYTPYAYEMQHKREMELRFKEREQEAEAEIINLKYKIDQLELKRLRDLADRAMQAELLALLNEEQKLLKLLAELREKELMRMNDEDTLIALLMSVPF